MNIKIQFKISKILFPKTGILSIGEYSIISCTLQECLTQGAKIQLNSIYNTFSLLSYTPVLFNFYDVYTAEVQETDTKYGISYTLINLEKEQNELTEGEKRSFLESCLTPLQVENLYAKFSNPYDLIAQKNTEQLLQVKGIGEKTVQHLYFRYESNLKYEKIILELKDYGLTKAIMNKLLETYKDAEVVVQKVKENPYLLADSVEGIGFKKADAIALQSGIKKNSPKRLEAFFKFYLNAEAEQGNSWILPNVLFGQIEPMLNTRFTDDEIRQVLYSLHDKKELSWNKDKTKIFLTKSFELEENIYKEIKRIQNGINHYHRHIDKENAIINNIEQEMGIELTNEQRNAISVILDNNMSILIGYGGCGKSLLIKVICEIFKQAGFSFGVCTLSGKASARIQELTGVKGSTIHRLLGYIPEEGFTYNKNSPLPYDVIIVDESSFVGGELFLDLISAIKDDGKIILVGDDKQLPAIGKCNVFFDCINSHKIPVAKLTKIHRQAQKSGIIVASKMVREGTQLVKNGWIGKETRGELQDFTIDIYDNKLYSNPKIIEWYKFFVKNLDDTFHTQIIVPMKYRGDFSTFGLNNQIQNIYNPKSKLKKEIQVVKNGQTYFLREGDKVINRKNNYKAKIYHEKKDSLDIDDDYETGEDELKNKTSIFNGFCGKIQQIKGNKIIVKFDLCEDEIEFDYEERNNLELAYALTVHLFQGSQIENVIIGIDNGSYVMNSRELIYTAITRASKKCVLLAESFALKHAIATTETNHKQTFLNTLLLGNEI